MVSEPEHNRYHYGLKKTGIPLSFSELAIISNERIIQWPPLVFMLLSYQIVKSAFFAKKLSLFYGIKNTPTHFIYNKHTGRESSK